MEQTIINNKILPIIMGLTTIPDRLKKGMTARAIKSVIEDEYRPEKIIVTIPENSMHIGKKYDMRILEEYPFNRDDIEINIVSEDIGPVLKVDGLIKLMIINEDEYEDKDKYRRIALIDDDIIYPPGILLELYNQSLLYENEGVGYAGRIFNGRDLMFMKTKGSVTKEVTFLETYHMAMYPSRLFIGANYMRWCEFLEEVHEKEEESKYTDDIVIGKWCKVMGIKRRIINSKKDVREIQNEGGEKLSDKNLRGRNMRVFKRVYLR